MNELSKLLLTGGTGFFGRALLRNLAARQRSGLGVPSVTVVTRYPDAFREGHPEFLNLPWLQLQSGNVCEPQALPKRIAFTHIIHAAADSTLGPKLSPLERYDQIVRGTRNLLDLGVACGAKRFLLISSGAVYGVQPPHLDALPETWQGMPDPLNPANAYGVAKRTAEHLCALYGGSSGLQTVVARCFAFLGRDLPMDAHFAIGNFIQSALLADAITVAGDGTSLRTYMDQHDLADWLLRLLEHGKSGEAYNVGGEEIVSVGELAYLIRDLLAPGKPINILRNFADSQVRNRYVPDIRKAREELGLRVRIPLAEAIMRTAQSRESSR